MKTFNGCGIKRAALINDLSCFGKCSLSVAMPIISSYGIETVPLPTAVLSTHTAGLGRYVLHDMTDEMQSFSEHWRDIRLKFDCIATGFMCSVEQLRFARSFIHAFADDDTLIIVDPVLGDNGSLYSCFSEEYVLEMRELVSLADIITPNRTEAALLSGLSMDADDEALLNALWCRNVIITGNDRGETIGYTASFDSKMLRIDKKKQHIQLHGAGDVFAAALCGELLNSEGYENALKNAADFCEECIADTIERLPAHRYGVWFEDALKRRHL